MWRFCTLITTWSHFSMFSWRLHDFVENGTKTHTKLWNKTTDFWQCQLIFIFKIRCLKARKPWLKVAEKNTNQTFFVPQSVIFIEPWFRVELEEFGAFHLFMLELHYFRGFWKNREGSLGVGKTKAIEITCWLRVNKSPDYTAEARNTCLKIQHLFKSVKNLGKPTWKCNLKMHENFQQTICSLWTLHSRLKMQKMWH